MCGLQICLCLFTLRFGGAVVTHPLWVQDVPGSIPGSGKGFLCLIFSFVVVVFLLFV